MTKQRQQTAPAPRFDAAAYVRANPHLVKRNAAMLRRFDELDARIRKDANLTAFLARDLVYQRAKIVETIYEKTRAAEFVPVEEGHPRGAKSYSTRRRNHVGQAKVTTDLAGEDPRVDVEVEEDLGKYVNVRASYAYTVEDMEHAAFSGTPLPSWKAQACADIIARGVDQVGQIGDSKVGLSGFFNDSNATVVTLTNGEWNNYPTTTAEQILADLQQIETALITQTRDNAVPGYTLVLPSVYEGILCNGIVPDSGGKNIKDWFLDSARLITSIERYFALDNAAVADIAASDAPMGICYRRSPDVLYWPMPIAYEEQTPQMLGWEWVIRARARVGGVVVEQPTQMLYIQNLD